MLTQDPQVDTLARELRDRHPDVPEHAIVGLVAEVYEDFRGARIRQFLPLLVARMVEDRLRGLTTR